MSEDSKRSSVFNAAANSHVHHVTLEDIAQFTPEKVNHIYRGGIRQGAGRTDVQAQQMVDKIPASQRAGVNGQSAAARTKEYLYKKDASHIEPHSKGGSAHPDNMKWENSSANRARGNKPMTPQEQKAIDAKANLDNLKGAVQRGMEAGLKGAVIGAVTTLPFSFLRNALRVSRGEMTNEAAALAILKDTGIGGALGGVTAISVTTVAAAFPPVAALLATASPALLVVGGVGMVSEFFKILEEHKQEVRDYYNSLTEQQLSYLQQVEDEMTYEHKKSLEFLDESQQARKEYEEDYYDFSLEGFMSRLNNSVAVVDKFLEKSDATITTSKQYKLIAHK
jgi:hypothetical protein